jgi:diaminopimelate decarboxylase
VTFVENRLLFLKSIFPSGTLHTIALKANPLPEILKRLRISGFGAEAATLPEVYIAEQSGFNAERIVFDSPAKTLEELQYSLKRGIHINADSFDELDRIASIYQTGYKSRIGIRINPQVGIGKISMLSVAGSYSKFGIPLEESRERLFEYYEKYSWLRGIHLHIGSQGCSIEQLVEGVKRVYDFAEEVNKRLNSRQIKFFDMGGGFPVSYHHDEEAPDMKKYADSLCRTCPGLFDGSYKLITEFGRYFFANSGWTATRVEYVKSYAGKKTAIVHVGADLLMRRIYQPKYWYHELSVADRYGNPKEGKKQSYVIAGPLCFNGDIISQEVLLPALDEGDFLIIHDTGGYTLSMWNRHTSRQIPLVLGYTNQGEDLFILKERESMQDVYRFWK